MFGFEEGVRCKEMIPDDIFIYLNVKFTCSFNNNVMQTNKGVLVNFPSPFGMQKSSTFKAPAMQGIS